MSIAVGTDILRVARIEEVLERQGERFVKRILSPVEQQEYQGHKQAQRMLAKRFAAKEAVAKALGTGIGRGVSWQDICIVHDDFGAPKVQLSGGAAEAAARRGGSRVELSLSDEEEYVIAFAILAS